MTSACKSKRVVKDVSWIQFCNFQLHLLNHLSGELLETVGSAKIRIGSFHFRSPGVFYEFRKIRLFTQF